MAKKQKPKYSLNSLVVCDDIRTEATGKEILIGVYNTLIIVPSLPAAFIHLWFRLAVDVDGNSAKDFTFRILNQDGRILTEVHQPLPEIGDEGSSILTFQVRGILIPEPTKLTISFGLDGRLEPVSTLVIREAKTDEERAKFQTPINA